MKFFYTTLIMCASFFSINCPAQTSPGSASAHLDINNADITVSQGSDIISYLIPKDSGISVIGAGGLWIGGIDAGGALHTAASTYRQNGDDFFPGPLDNSGAITPALSSLFDRIWKINKTTIDSFRMNPSYPTVPANDIPLAILEWPGKGNSHLTFPSQSLAPFFDKNNDGFYSAESGDYPLFPGDQALWWVYNDAGNVHNQTNGLPLGVEVQVLAYAFKNANCLYDASFFQYSITKKTIGSLHNVHVGNFIDADLGCFYDDYIGCDTIYNMGVAYNADSIDGPCSPDYGSSPPMLGAVYVPGSSNISGASFKISNFGYYKNDFTDQGNPIATLDYYNYLTGKWINNIPWTNGEDGANPSLQPTHFIYPDSPHDPNGWSACSAGSQPNDQRMIMSMGPYNLSQGNYLQFTVMYLWDRTPGIYPCPSFQTMKDKADCIYSQNIFTGISNTLHLTKQEVTFFPNPMEENGVMNFENIAGSKIIFIYDLTGRQIRRYATSDSSLQISRNGLSSGIYFYNIRGGDGNPVNGKIIIR